MTDIATQTKSALEVEVDLLGDRNGENDVVPLLRVCSIESRLRFSGWSPQKEDSEQHRTEQRQNNLSSASSVVQVSRAENSHNRS